MGYTTKEELHERVEHDGGYHKVDNPVIMEKMQKLREQYITLGHAVVDELPVSREQSLALKALLDESLVMAIAALARHQDEVMKEVTGQ